MNARFSLEHRLVADLDQRPAQGAFDGTVLDARHGQLVQSQSALWRLEGEDLPPTLLLRDTANRPASSLGGGFVLAAGVDAAGVLGLWVTDGAKKIKIAPEDFPAATNFRLGNLAFREGIALAKTVWLDGVGDGLWRLGEGAEPQRLGPSGASTQLDDPTIFPACGAVLTTARGFLHCRYVSASGATLMLHDGRSEVPIPGLVVRHLGPSLQLGTDTFAIVDLPAQTPTGGRGAILRSDGTLAGTTLFDDLEGSSNWLTAFRGGLAWITQSGLGWRARASDGRNPPVDLASGTGLTYVRILGTVDHSIYLQGHVPATNGRCALLRIDPLVGESRSFDVGNRCARSPVVQADGLGGAVVILDDDRLWRLGPGDPQPIPGPAFPWNSEITLTAADGNPLLPWVDASGRMRMGLASGGAIEPYDALGLSGTQGSRSHVVGEIRGEAILFGFDAGGAQLWRSRGTSTTTIPLESRIASRCARFGLTAPLQIGPTALLDCPDWDGTSTVWVFDSQWQHRSFEIPTNGSISRHGAAAQLAGRLVFLDGDEVIGLNFDDGSTVPLVPACVPTAFVGLAVRAIVACSADSGEVWSTDGRQAGTILLLDGSPSPALVPAGDRAVITSPGGSWVTDGTAAGTVGIDPISRALAAPPSSTWTCVFTQDGTVSRLDLESGHATPLSQAGSQPVVFPSGSSATVLPFLARLEGAGQMHVWRCDGTREGTGPLRPVGIEWYPSQASMVVVGDHVWKYWSTLEREHLEILSLVDGTSRVMINRRLLLNDERRTTLWYRSDPGLAFAADFVWAILADRRHGSEPRAFPWSGPRAGWHTVRGEEP